MSNKNLKLIPKLTCDWPMELIWPTIYSIYSIYCVQLFNLLISQKYFVFLI